MPLSDIFLYFLEGTSLKNVIHAAYWVPLTRPSLILTARVELISPCLQSASFPRAAATKFRVPAKIMSFERYRPRHSEVPFGSGPWCWTRKIMVGISWVIARLFTNEKNYESLVSIAHGMDVSFFFFFFYSFSLRDNINLNVENWSGFWSRIKWKEREGERRK